MPDSFRELVNRHIEQGNEIFGLFRGCIQEEDGKNYIADLCELEYPDEPNNFLEITPELIRQSNPPAEVGIGSLFSCVIYMPPFQDLKIELVFPEPREFTAEEKARIEGRAAQLQKAYGVRDDSDEPILSSD